MRLATLLVVCLLLATPAVAQSENETEPPADEEPDFPIYLPIGLGAVVALILLFVYVARRP